MTPAMQAARDRVVEAARRRFLITEFSARQSYNPLSHIEAINEYAEAIQSLFALEAKEQADAEG